MYNNSRTRGFLKVDPRTVPASRHCIFIRGLPHSAGVDRVKEFFMKESRSPCQVEFFSASEDRRYLFVALRFESHSLAKDMMLKFDGQRVLESPVQITWFKDLKKASSRRFHDGGAVGGPGGVGGGGSHNFYSRGSGHPGRGSMSRPYSRMSTGGYYHTRDRTRTSRGHTHTSGGDDDVDTRRYSRSRSRSRSRSLSRSRSRSHSSRGEESAPRAYRSASSGSVHSSRSRSLSPRHGDSATSSRRASPMERMEESSKASAMSGMPATPPPLNGNKRSHGPHSPLNSPPSSKRNSRDPSRDERMESNLSKAAMPMKVETAQEKIRRKKLELEQAYKKDCETFSTVTKLLISKDRELEERILSSLKEVLRELGQQCIQDLRVYINKVMEKSDT